jgi:hypothetical protein
LAATDDHLTTPKAFERVFGKMKKQVVEYCWLQPADFGLKTIGHFDFFRKTNGSKLWKLASDWFEIHSENKKNTILTETETFEHELFNPHLRFL